MLDLSNFRQTVQNEGGLNRRLMLSYGAALAAIPFARPRSAVAAPKLSSTPFTLGVASGDPSPTDVVLWTKLAPAPVEPYGGMPPVSVPVEWQVAEDEAMSKVVASGSAMAMPQLGHSIHVTPKGLRPNRWYWFRFRTPDYESPVGRTRTMPASDELPSQLNFAVTSCQSFEAGLFTAYEQMASDAPDLVFHLGDYIYEYASGRLGKVRTHIGGETTSLHDYRRRYAQYRMDTHLSAMHASCPWFVTWDDHEFDNNFADDISEESNVDPIAFLERRANAAQAYYEMMPLRPRSMPRGPDIQLFRKASFGQLAEFMVLDTRQYRTDQPNGDGRDPLNADATNPKNSLLGKRQKSWLKHSLLSSDANWNVLAQQVMMGLVTRWEKDGERQYSMDQWPGYAAERAEILEFLKDRRVPNPVVLTGDIHSNWANELRVDDRVPEQELVASEFVATSLTSGGNGPKTPRGLDVLLSNNPCVKFHDQQRGYIRCTLTSNSWTSEYMIIDDVERHGGTTTSAKKLVVESGSPTIHSA